MFFYAIEVFYSIKNRGKNLHPLKDKKTKFCEIKIGSGLGGDSQSLRLINGGFTFLNNLEVISADTSQGNLEKQPKIPILSTVCRALLCPRSLTVFMAQIDNRRRVFRDPIRSLCRTIFEGNS